MYKEKYVSFRPVSLLLASYSQITRPEPDLSPYINRVNLEHDIISISQYVADKKGMCYCYKYVHPSVSLHSSQCYH
jgi:hypothetical protein